MYDPGDKDDWLVEELGEEEYEMYEEELDW